MIDGFPCELLFYFRENGLIICLPEVDNAQAILVKSNCLVKGGGENSDSESAAALSWIVAGERCNCFCMIDSVL